jgi:hypothetical protein
MSLRIITNNIIATWVSPNVPCSPKHCRSVQAWGSALQHDHLRTTSNLSLELNYPLEGLQPFIDNTAWSFVFTASLVWFGQISRSLSLSRRREKASVRGDYIDIGRISSPLSPIKNLRYVVLAVWVCSNIKSSDHQKANRPSLNALLL